ncbi:MAG TPA: phospholipase D-like domain-containing protein [bacterium]|nr:phospholipase D-like domain-containing protein [bacterium]HOL47150.1 phospholipase D-like domain-containing protein [bacterium]HPQ18073.1 phospholipase D-like domain-containing protein [bacterium]
MKKNIIKIWSVLFIIIFCFNSAPQPKKQNKKSEFVKTKQVTFLMNTQYYPALLREIKKAKEEIIVLMFLVRFEYDENNPIYILAQELVKAKKRGVDVKVFLDDFIIDEKLGSAANEIFYKYLDKNDIKVYIDETEKIYHTKLIIIDKEVVIVGSGNWTTSSFTLNNETSVLIRSKTIAESFLEKIKHILEHF